MDIFEIVPNSNLDSHNYYDILGCSSSAGQKELTKAYRDLSRKYHPDSHANDEEASTKFLKIGEAYATLCDPNAVLLHQSRNQNQQNVFDSFGEDGAEETIEIVLPRTTQDARHNYENKFGKYQESYYSEGAIVGFPYAIDLMETLEEYATTRIGCFCGRLQIAMLPIWLIQKELDLTLSIVEPLLTGTVIACCVISFLYPDNQAVDGVGGIALIFAFFLLHFWYGVTRYPTLSERSYVSWLMGNNKNAIDVDMQDVRDVCSYYLHDDYRQRSQLWTILTCLPVMIVDHLAAALSSILFMPLELILKQTTTKRRNGSSSTFMQQLSKSTGALMSIVAYYLVWILGGTYWKLGATVALLVNQKLYTAILFQQGYFEFLQSFVFHGIVSFSLLERLIASKRDDICDITSSLNSDEELDIKNTASKNNDDDNDTSQGGFADYLHSIFVGGLLGFCTGERKKNDPNTKKNGNTTSIETGGGSHDEAVGGSKNDEGTTTTAMDRDGDVEESTPRISSRMVLMTGEVVFSNDGLIRDDQIEATFDEGVSDEDKEEEESVTSEDLMNEIQPNTSLAPRMTQERFDIKRRVSLEVETGVKNGDKNNSDSNISEENDADARSENKKVDTPEINPAESIELESGGIEVPLSQSEESESSQVANVPEISRSFGMVSVYKSVKRRLESDYYSKRSSKKKQPADKKDEVPADKYKNEEGSIPLNVTTNNNSNENAKTNMLDTQFVDSISIIRPPNQLQSKLMKQPAYDFSMDGDSETTDLKYDGSRLFSLTSVLSSQDDGNDSAAALSPISSTLGLAQNQTFLYSVNHSQSSTVSGPRSSTASGLRSSTASGPRSSTASGPRSSTNSGPRSSTASGPRSSTNSGPHSSLASGITKTMDNLRSTMRTRSFAASTKANLPVSKTADAGDESLPHDQNTFYSIKLNKATAASSTFVAVTEVPTIVSTRFSQEIDDEELTRASTLESTREKRSKRSSLRSYGGGRSTRTKDDSSGVLPTRTYATDRSGGVNASTGRCDQFIF